MGQISGGDPGQNYSGANNETIFDVCQGFAELIVDPSCIRRIVRVDREPRIAEQRAVHAGEGLEVHALKSRGLTFADVVMMRVYLVGDPAKGGKIQDG